MFRSFRTLMLMLWSQIKLASFDFSDLHITGESDNRPGTGRFLRIFSCVVTYRTGAGRRLYIKTSADARRCKRSAGHRTVPVRFYTNFSRAVMNTLISKFAIIPPNKQVVTKEKLRLTLTVMVMKTILAQDCKNFNSTCWLQVNHPELLKQNTYFVFMFWSLEVEYLCKCNMYFCKNTSLLTGGFSTHITSAGARTGIVRCPDVHGPI